MVFPETEQMRFDLQVIASWIDPGSRVLDLGCGHGADSQRYRPRHHSERARFRPILVAVCLLFGSPAH